MKSSFDSNPIKFQTPDTTKLTHTADNNNVSLDVFQIEQKQFKLDRKFKVNHFERDQQYEDVNAIID